MKKYIRRYAWSLAIALVWTAALVTVAGTVRRWSPVGVLLLPGMLGAAIVFPQGPEGDWPDAYMLLAGLMNVFLYSWLMYGAWALIERARRRNQTTKDVQ
jgi:uncharacterized membrane protein YoaT (DUF817 family)